MTSFKTRNEPKMKVFEFGAFQNKMHMASREKYIFHMLFGAFHDTPGIDSSLQFRNQENYGHRSPEAMSEIISVSI